jgi:hypothetical protein
MRCLALAAAAAAAVAAAAASASQPKPGPLQVFLLAGQSNMEGQSPTDSTDPNPGCTGCPHRNGTLAWMVHNETRAEVQAWSRKLVNTDGSWLVLPSVWMWGNENQGTTNWTVGNGVTKDANGPEYGFGYGIAQSSPNQALLAKWARGGTSLAQDWRPPSSGGTVGPLFVESVAAWKSLLTTENLTAKVAVDVELVLEVDHDGHALHEAARDLHKEGVVLRRVQEAHARELGPPSVGHAAMQKPTTNQPTPRKCYA